LRDHPDSAQVRRETGLQDECALHESAYFHVTENYVFDAMHDFYEGIVPYEVKLVLKHYVQIGLFDVDFLNRRIHSFAYGITEVKNKPSSNFTLSGLQNALHDHKLKQKSAQMTLLLRALPFLLSDKVPDNDAHMRILLLFSDILSIVFVPKIHAGTLATLPILIREHSAMFKELFPEASFINKHHHVEHYPLFMKKMGPAATIHGCIRYEGKHHDLARHGSVCCNFRNLPKTLARVVQIVQTRYWGDPQVSVWDQIEVHGGEKRVVADLPFCNELVAGFEVNAGDQVFLPNTVEVRGTEYRRNVFVLIRTGMETEDSLPIFGRIVDIFVVHSTSVVLVVNEWTILYFEESLRSYAIHEQGDSVASNRTTLVLTSDLPDYRTMSTWKSFRDGDANIYVCPRTSFF